MRMHRIGSIALAVALCLGCAPAYAAAPDSTLGKFEGAGDSHHRYADDRIWSRRLSIRQLESAALRAPRDVRTLNRLGEAYLIGGFFHSATETFERVLALAPSDANAHFGLGRISEWAWLDAPAPAKLYEALAQFEAAVAAQPTFDEAWVALAAARYELREARSAYEAASHALALSPDGVEGQLAVAYLAYRTGHIARADSLFRVAIPRCPAGIAERFADITPLLSEPQQADFAELNPKAKPEYARRFWSASDPDPTTPQNEARLEYWSRLAHVLLLIGDPWSPRWMLRTDLYARYGRLVQVHAGDADAAPQTEMSHIAWGEAPVDPTPQQLAILHQNMVGNGVALFAPLPPGAREMRVATLVSRFEGPHGARLAMRVETPGAPVDSVLADCVVLDETNREIARGVHLLSPSGCDPAAAVSGEFTFDVPPGRYKLAVAVHDGAGGRGVAHTTRDVLPLASALAMSDVVLACAPSRVADHQGPVLVSPNLRARVADKQDLYAYFEVYHLRQDARGENRFEYEYTVRILGKDASKPNAHVAHGAPQLSFRSSQEGVGPLRRQFITVPTGSLPAGRYRLTIAVRDQLAGTTTEQSTEFVRAAAER